MVLGNNTNTSTRNEDFQGWVQGPDTRGTLDIIWSCVAVLVTALWTVLHLNIPGSSDTMRHLLARKFRWGCVSIMYVSPGYKVRRSCKTPDMA
jgi:hypothetical protein